VTTLGGVVVVIGPLAAVTELVAGSLPTASASSATHSE
jgi:hypothetical protein